MWCIRHDGELFSPCQMWATKSIASTIADTLDSRVSRDSAGGSMEERERQKGQVIKSEYELNG